MDTASYRKGCVLLSIPGYIDDCMLCSTKTVCANINLKSHNGSTDVSIKYTEYRERWMAARLCPGQSDHPPLKLMILCEGEREESCWVSRQIERARCSHVEKHTEFIKKYCDYVQKYTFPGPLIRYQISKLYSLNDNSSGHSLTENWEQSPGSCSWTGRENRFAERIHSSQSVIMEQMLLASKIVSMLILGLVTWIIGIVPMISVRKGNILLAFCHTCLFCVEKLIFIKHPVFRLAEQERERW